MYHIEVRDHRSMYGATWVRRASVREWLMALEISGYINRTQPDLDVRIST